MPQEGDAMSRTRGSGLFALLLALAMAGQVPAATAGDSGLTPTVTSPPEAFFDRFKVGDREAARLFYKKHLDADGLSIAAAAVVADEALERTYHIVTHILAGRPDV